MIRAGTPKSGLVAQKVTCDKNAKPMQNAVWTMGSTRERLAASMLRYSNNIFVITCRSNDFAGTITGKELYLDKLSPKEIKLFIRRREPLLNGTSSKRFYSDISVSTFSLRHAIHSPFYLNLLIYYFSLKKSLPDSYPLLFREICADWAAREAKKQFPGALRPAPSPEAALANDAADHILIGLSVIGFVVSTSAGFGTFIDIDGLKHALTTLATATPPLEAALKAGERGGMLDFNHTTGQVRFIHQIPRILFCGVYQSSAGIWCVGLRIAKIDF